MFAEVAVVILIVAGGIAVVLPFVVRPRVPVSVASLAATLAFVVWGATCARTLPDVERAAAAEKGGNRLEGLLVQAAVYRGLLYVLFPLSEVGMAGLVVSRARARRGGSHGA